MPSRPDVGVVVVAAGQGLRAGADQPKQFREVGGVPVLLRAVRPFLAHPEVRQVIAVVPAATAATPPEWLGPLVGDRLRLVAGGPERSDSVARGLAALDPDLAVVAVHDGARPFVDAGVFERLLAVARGGRGAVAALPVSDTLKLERVDGDERTVARTVPRAGLWRAQTPQVFPLRLLAGALAAAAETGLAITDDASAAEAFGIPVVLVRDRVTNLKLTTTEDFDLAEAIAARLGR